MLSVELCMRILPVCLKHFQPSCSEEALCGYFALRWIARYFPIDEVVVKADGGGVLAGAGKVHRSGSGPVDGAKAHGTGFAGGVQNAFVELEGVELSAGVPYGFDFGMGGGILAQQYAVIALAYYLPIPDDYGTKGSAIAASPAFIGQLDGELHKCFMFWSHRGVCLAFCKETKGLGDLVPRYDFY